jgi:hypothetical protein
MRNGVSVDDVTSEVTRMHAEHTSEASASSFGGSALALTARGRNFCTAFREIRKILKNSDCILAVVIGLYEVIQSIWDGIDCAASNSSF